MLQPGLESCQRKCSKNLQRARGPAGDGSAGRPDVVFSLDRECERACRGVALWGWPSCDPHGMRVGGIVCELCATFLTVSSEVAALEQSAQSGSNARSRDTSTREWRRSYATPGVFSTQNCWKNSGTTSASSTVRVVTSTPSPNCFSSSHSASPSIRSTGGAPSRVDSF